ncbi:MAG: FkbM family methyltransferase [Spirochaetes bacterium]|jgi:FkbM family methyltransferase|nr:FkbM family methyltransferase [Spirochaetota bacterium]
MKKIKRFIRDLARKAGYDIRLYGPGHLGRDPLVDTKFFLEGTKSPVIFDVGANIGQSVDKFKKIFPDSQIYSFEPGPDVYAKLRVHCEGMKGVKTYNRGVGSRHTTLPLVENMHSNMSSFLEPGEYAWGGVEKRTNAEIITLDSFAKEEKIDYIHILKSDTQGYDFEVFKGAEGLMKENRIGLIYFEFIFVNMYKDLPLFTDVFNFLKEHNYFLVSFYQTHFQQNMLSWTDFLFINNDLNHGIIEKGIAVNTF